MDSAGDHLGGQAGQGHPDWVGGGLRAAEVDEETQIVVFVRTPSALAVRRGDVVGGAPTLALGVLCGHRGELARPGQLGNGGGVADGVYLGVAGHGQVLVDHQPTALGLQANLVDEWVGPYADAPDQGARRDDLAVGQRDTVRGRLAHGHAGAYVDPAGAQDRVGRARQPRVQLRQDSLREVQQQPPGTGAQPRVPGVEDVGVQNLLRGDLGAGVARADHDERDAGGALDGVVGLVGQLDLRGHVVAQVQCLGDAPKPWACSLAPGMCSSLWTLPTASTSRS